MIVMMEVSQRVGVRSAIRAASENPYGFPSFLAWRTLKMQLKEQDCGRGCAGDGQKRAGACAETDASGFPYRAAIFGVRRGSLRFMEDKHIPFVPWPRQ